ncbi:MAG: hypothetical protein GY835_23305 [bacterium]|nr:hypothetical protein [bacterium]
MPSRTRTHHPSRFLHLYPALVVFSLLTAPEVLLGQSPDEPPLKVISTGGWEQCLIDSPQFCIALLRATVEGAEEKGVDIPSSVRDLYETVKEAAAAEAVPIKTVTNICYLLGQTVDVPIPGSTYLVDPEPTRTVSYTIGASDCNGRCGAGCPNGGIPGCYGANGYFRYTEDCMVHDACCDYWGTYNWRCDLIFPSCADDCGANGIDCCPAYDYHGWTEPVQNFCGRCGPCSEGEGDCDSDVECEGGLICEWSPFGLDTCEQNPGIELIEFRAESAGGLVVISWDSAERGSRAGWNIHRRRQDQSEFVKVNTAIIVDYGGPYRYRDTAVDPGVAYFYMLEAVGLNDARKHYGPVAVAVGGIE